MFLSPDDLKELTGYVQYTAQCRWLAANGYQFDRRRDGRPMVLVDQIRARQGAAEPANDSESKPGPDFGWMDEAG